MESLIDILKNLEWNSASRCSKGTYMSFVLSQSETDGYHSNPSPAKHSTERIPLELLIFGRGLSARQIYQLRTISKTWREILDELLKPRLSETALPVSYSGAGNGECWFIMAKARPDRRRARNSCLYSWDFVAFSNNDQTVFRPPLPNIHHAQLSTLLGGRNCNLLVKDHLKSAGNLICAVVFCIDDYDYKDIIVFNCLTGFVEVLPTPIYPKFLWKSQRSENTISSSEAFSLQISMDESNYSHYYVMLSTLPSSFVLYDAELQPYFYVEHIEVYDSTKESWEEVGCRIHSYESDGMKLFHGDFFFCYMIRDDTNKVEAQQFVLAYHVAEDKWTRVQVETPVSISCIGKCNGRLLSCYATRNNYSWTGFHVMELQYKSSTGTAMWVKVSSYRLPMSVSSHSVVIEFLNDGRLFFFSFRDIGVNHLLSPYMALQKKVLPPIVYDMAQNSWYSLRPELSPTDDFNCWLLMRPLLGH